MFSKVTSAIRSDPSRKQAQDDHIARIAITEDGMVAYASEAFCEISHIPLESLKNSSAQKLISVGDKAQKNMPLTDLNTGLHKIYINGHKEAFSFHFDWLQTPDNKRYLVGSETVNNKKPSKAAVEKLLDIIRQNAKPQQKIIAAPAPVDQSDLQRFIDLSQEAMIMTDDFGLIEHSNKTFRSISGYDQAELSTLNFADLFDEHDKHWALQAGKSSFEARILNKDGQPRWISWNREISGTKIYYSGRDITDIKTQKTALDQREKQLSEAESIGRMGHWHWTIGEIEMQWSDEIYRIFGVTKDGFKPTLETMNKMVHRSDISRLNQAFQRAIIEENDYDMEFRILTSSGETRFIRCEGRCARDLNGEVTALYGIMQDMTERMLYETELKSAKESAERAYAARTQFLANMSHELRTPLNAIIGFSEMIQHQLLGPIGTPKYLEYIAGIRESGEHLLDLISDILDMSKIEAGKYELDLSEIYPAKLIKLATHMMEGRAHEAKVKVTMQKDLNENLKIVADRRAVLQILLNLLSNAVKFTPEGGEVSVQMVERENNCWIKVTDNGIGIPANKLATITKPFEQVSSSYSRDHQGSGLGLAITKELVEMHGGTLFIESVLDKGTTVTIKLPNDGFKKAKKN